MASRDALLGTWPDRLTESGTIDPGMPYLQKPFTVARFAAFLRRAEED